MFSIHSKTLKSFGTLQDEAIRIAETAGLDAQQANEAKRLYDNMKKNGGIQSPLGAWKWACEQARDRPSASTPTSKKADNRRPVPMQQRDYSGQVSASHATHSPKPTALELARERVEAFGFTYYEGRRITKLDELK